MIRIGHGFAAVFNAFGDWGNPNILAARLVAAGLAAEVEAASEGLPDLRGCQGLVVGASTLEALDYAWPGLVAARETISRFLAAGGLVLATGLPATAFGRALTQDGVTRAGMGLTDQSFTVQAAPRYADCLWTTTVAPGDVIGPLNTALTWTDSRTPWFRLRLSSDPATPGCEGCQTGALFTTQVIGPVLVRNPALVTALAGRLAGRPLPGVPDDQAIAAFARRGHHRGVDRLTRTLRRSAGRSG